MAAWTRRRPRRRSADVGCRNWPRPTTAPRPRDICSPRLFDRLGQKAMFDSLEAPTEAWFGPDPVAQARCHAAIDVCRRGHGGPAAPGRRSTAMAVGTAADGHLPPSAAQMGRAYAAPPSAAARWPRAPTASRLISPPTTNASRPSTARPIGRSSTWRIGILGRATNAPGQSGQPGSPY